MAALRDFGPFAAGASSLVSLTRQLEGRAESVNSLHPRRHTVKHMKAAIQGSGSTPHHAAPSTKVSNAQIAGFAKLAHFPTAVIRVECGEQPVRAQSTEYCGNHELTLRLDRGLCRKKDIAHPAIPCGARIGRNEFGGYCRCSGKGDRVFPAPVHG